MCDVPPPSPVSTPHLFTHTWAKVGVVKGVDEGGEGGVGGVGERQLVSLKHFLPHLIMQIYLQ